MYCSYYQAFITASEKVLFFTATFRSNDHLASDRALKPEENLFEFYVPLDREQDFLKIMAYYQNNYIIRDLVKLPNRLINEKL
jgi:hypothetical protein